MKIRHAIIAIALCLLTALSAMGAGVKFAFADQTISDGPLRTKMEANGSALLSELDRAAASRQPLDLSRIDIQPRAAERLKALWKSIRFRPAQKSYTVRCLNDVQGFQARGLVIEMLADGRKYAQGRSRELTVSFDAQGSISGVRPAIESKQISGKILRKGVPVTEAAERSEILKFVEDLCSFYNEKDLPALKAVYSDDALIITGSVIRRLSRQPGDGGPTRITKEVSYKVKTKKQYIDALARQFARNKRVRVEFSDISVARHPVKDHIYSVSLFQKYSTDSYSDQGYLFLIWDFSDPKAPRISVRNWQDPDYTRIKGLPKLSDFFFP